MIERRLEEASPHLATRSDRLVGSQSIFLGEHTAVTFLRNGLRMLVNTRNLDVGIHLLTLGDWEQADMAYFPALIQPGDRVLNIGANLCIYALHAALAVGQRGEVHAFTRWVFPIHLARANYSPAMRFPAAGRSFGGVFPPTIRRSGGALNRIN